MDQVLSFSQQLIQIPSTTDDLSAIEEAVFLVEKQLSTFTIKSFISDRKPSLLIHNAGINTKNFKIIINAHLDVVYGEESQFTPFIKDGKLYGRGAYDMKAAAATIIMVFKKLANHISFPLALQITTDEEIGTLGAKKQVEEGYRGEFILTGECGSNFKITNQAKGVYNIKVTTSGIKSHSAYPWRGDNAIVKLQKALANITDKYPLPKEESYATTVNITMIRTNNKTWNRTPDHAEAYIDVRYMPEDKNILNDLRKLLSPDIKIEAIQKYSYSAINTNPNNPYIKSLQKIGKQILNQEIPFRVAHATSDLVRFAAVGCDGIEFGPIGSNQHGDNEWVNIKSLGEYYQILTQFLLSIK
ncbi:MAG TPA: M20/M25/M40 family metallo-hydrolase [Candidatus Sulfotelmatobacter sp.]|jgi:succinyl-diaminopimelate desuccinylase|nr:M20/M25/M40 family metallo-hydrolase [Candidatus Sulfotelmatobacter sp.]